jgi:hypothetical protein
MKLQGLRIGRRSLVREIFFSPWDGPRKNLERISPQSFFLRMWEIVMTKSREETHS